MSRYTPSDVDESPVATFLRLHRHHVSDPGYREGGGYSRTAGFRCTRQTETATITHTLMTGGKFHFQYEQDALLHERMAATIRNGGVLPCLTEQHTPVFPFYLDIDGKFPVQTLTDAAIVRFTEAVMGRVIRFFPLLTEPIECIVLDKTGDAVETDGGLFKHGLHIHFPRLLVNVDQARQIHVGITSGLACLTWTEEFGTATLDWEDIVDASVYNHGLRMIGCPKASRCCSIPSCPRCRGWYIIDDRVYKLRMAFSGETRCLELERTLQANIQRLIKRTSVRCPHDAEVTDGFATYRGCPEVRKPGSRKRKGDTQMSRAMTSVDGRQGDVMTDPRSLEVIRAILVKFSPLYEVPQVFARRMGNIITVNLQGDNSTYCINKRDYHRSNRVYMVIRPGKSNDHLKAVMKCYCRCAQPRPGPLCRLDGGTVGQLKTCGKFEHPMDVSHTDFLSSCPASPPQRRRPRLSRTFNGNAPRIDSATCRTPTCRTGGRVFFWTGTWTTTRCYDDSQIQKLLHVQQSHKYSGRRDGGGARTRGRL